MNKFFLSFLFVIALTSCLQTTADLRNNPHRPAAAGTAASAPAAPAPVTRQQKEALETLRTDDINHDFRELNGRVEVVENQMNQLQDNPQVKALEAKVAQLENKMGLLETTVADLNSRVKKDIPVMGSSDARDLAKKDIFKDNSPLAEANKLFDGKKWEDAILAFEEYRKANPKGKNYTEATYKIGLCFQNLSMKDDARAFFKEVVDKYPQSKEAGLAKTKLKKL